eukprot:1631757-Prymnesium_polylepis.1
MRHPPVHHVEESEHRKQQERPERLERVHAEYIAPQEARDGEKLHVLEQQDLERRRQCGQRWPPLD